MDHVPGAPSPGSKMPPPCQRCAKRGRQGPRGPVPTHEPQRPVRGRAQHTLGAHACLLRSSKCTHSPLLFTLEPGQKSVYPKSCVLPKAAIHPAAKRRPRGRLGWAEGRRMAARAGRGAAAGAPTNASDSGPSFRPSSAKVGRPLNA